MNGVVLQPAVAKEQAAVVQHPAAEGNSCPGAHDADDAPPPVDKPAATAHIERSNVAVVPPVQQGLVGFKPLVRRWEVLKYNAATKSWIPSYAEVPVGQLNSPPNDNPSQQATGEPTKSTNHGEQQENTPPRTNLGVYIQRTSAVNGNPAGGAAPQQA